MVDALSISADGRYVAFRSDASNLAGGDTNDAADIFVRDLQTGTTTRVSVSSTGGQVNSDCVWSSISAGGRYVAFDSRARNLVQGDTNDARDVFVRDLGTSAVLNSTPTPTPEGPGNITGYVIRSVGSSGVAGAQVRAIRYLPSVTEVTRTTDRSGSYRFDNLPAGAYKLKVNAVGFLEKTSSGFVVRSGQTSTVGLALSTLPASSAPKRHIILIKGTNNASEFGDYGDGQNRNSTSLMAQLAMLGYRNEDILLTKLSPDGLRNLSFSVNFIRDAIIAN